MVLKFESGYNKEVASEVGGEVGFRDGVKFDKDVKGGGNVIIEG